MKYIQRRQSKTTGDAIWMKFECGAGSRWTSTTEDSTGDVCGFSGCNCGTRIKFMGDTEDRRAGWFGLRVGQTESDELPRTVNGRQLVNVRYYENLDEQQFAQQYWTPEQIQDGRRVSERGIIFHLMNVL